MCEWLLSDIFCSFSGIKDLDTNHCGSAATQHNRLQCVRVCVCDGGLAILSRLNEVSNNMPEAMLETGHTHRVKEAGLKIVAIRVVNLRLK